MDTTGTNGINVMGRVLSKKTGAGVLNATVTLAGKSTSTVASGAYAITNVDLTDGNTLQASRASYQLQSVTVTAAAGVKSVVMPDIFLSGTTDKPVMELVIPSITGLYLRGFGIQFTGKAHVNWNNNTQGSVAFYANDQQIASLDGSGPDYSNEFSVDSMFTPSLLSGKNEVTVIATDSTGNPSDPFNFNVVVIPLPSALMAFMVNPANIVNSGPAVSLKVKFPDPSITRTVSLPVVGTFGASFQASGEFKYKVNSGEYEFDLGQSTSGLQKGGHVFLGSSDIGIDLGCSGEGVATPSKGINLNELSLYAGLAYEKE